MKKAVSALLALVTLLSLVVFPTSPAAASALSAGQVVYYEDFERGNLSGNANVLSALGWTLSEKLNKNTAKYSISNGKLICDNSTASVGSSKDSYVTMLDDAAMSEIAANDYTIVYDLRYVAAENDARYAAVIYNYNGYENYNSVHIRANGSGNNQVRVYGSTWKTYDEPASGAKDAEGFLASTGSHAISSVVFGQAYSTAAPYPLIDRPMTVMIKVDVDRGPSVYINGVQVSAPNDTCRELFLSTQQYASAIALKTSPKIKAEIDNIMVYTGLGEIPANKTVTYQYPTAEDHGNVIHVMSLNTLYSNSGDVAFADGMTRGQHMVSLIYGENPDVIGLQERASEVRTNMTNLLVATGHFAIVDENRTDTTRSGVIMETPIAYNTDTYELVANNASNGNLAHGNFVYTNFYQTRNGGPSASSSYTKSFAWAVLRCKATGQLVLAMNTHAAVHTSSYAADYTSAMAVSDRIKNAAEAIAKYKQVLAQFGNLPAFYTGDFNMKQNEEAYRLLETEFEDAVNMYSDSFLYEYTMSNDSSTITNPGFLRDPNTPIDHIFYTSGRLTVTNYYVLNKCPEMRVASDHVGIRADFTVEPVAAPVCSHKTGVYKGTQKLTLSGDGIFYFTTDGSDPRTSDTRKTYAGYIPVLTDTEVRFCAYKSGRYSNVARVTIFTDTPLYFTEIAKNTKGSDLYEGMEIINVSAAPVDLYDFRVWYYNSSDPTACKNASADNVTTNMRLSQRPGEYIVEPGEVVFVHTIFSDVYNQTRKVSSGKTARLVEMDPVTAKPVYRTDYTASLIALEGYGSVSADRIIPLDRTAQSFGYTASGAAFARFDSKSDTVINLTATFNLGNNTYNRVYLSFANDANSSLAFCVADLDGTGGGTSTDGSTVTSKEGAYYYLPVEGSTVMKTAGFTSGSGTFGTLNNAQKAAFMLKNRSEDYTYTYLPGDANNDRRVNGADLVALRRYLASVNVTTGTSPYTVSAGADADCSGATNAMDIALLRTYLANYNYVTGESSVVLGNH